MKSSDNTNSLSSSRASTNRSVLSRRSSGLKVNKCGLISVVYLKIIHMKINCYPTKSYFGHNMNRITTFGNITSKSVEYTVLSRIHYGRVCRWGMFFACLSANHYQ